MVSGALFGTGWWFWLDACTLVEHKVPFDQYLPGIIATLALVMINLIRKDELAELDPFDDASYCRYVVIVMHMLPCTHAQATMHKLPCTCYYAHATMHKLPCTCYYVDIGWG